MITKKINKENKRIIINLLYKASADSDSAAVFHEKCDSANNTIVLVETKDGKRFGDGNTVIKIALNALKLVMIIIINALNVKMIYIFTAIRPWKMEVYPDHVIQIVKIMDSSLKLMKIEKNVVLVLSIVINA